MLRGSGIYITAFRGNGAGNLTQHGYPLLHGALTGWMVKEINKLPVGPGAPKGWLGVR